MKAVSIQHSTPDSVGHDLREILSAKLQINAHEIPGVMALGELGLDSFALSDLAEAVEEKFDVQVPDRIFPAALTINQLVTLLGGTTEESPRRGPLSVGPAH